MPEQGSPHAEAWYTSSYSGKDNNCVEYSRLVDGRHAIRDTKDPRRRISIYFTNTAWQAFIESQKRSTR
ncbi:DUF397 domain-containing protein [Streptomyces sp. NPDC049577]|uniref:DUF397 domain-containing protein n=1 Tax=Streptomyces sp. NPDC049577 TaxID=3155153 RepID=UPI003412E182